MQFDELIKGLGERLQVALTTEDGVCTLGIDDMTVTLMELRELDALVITGEMGEPPPQGLEKLYRVMLEANHNFTGTAGATISLDPERHVFRLCRMSQLVATDVDALVTMLERFVNTLEAWRKLIADYRPVAERAAAAVEKESEAPFEYHMANSGFMSV